MSLIGSAEIANYIPQKAPIVMVGELISNSDDLSISQFKIEAENIFCSDTHFTEPGLIENIAQTAALRMGYISSQKGEGERPPVGFIGAISKLKIHNLPEIGKTIQTTVEIRNDIFGITLIHGFSKCEGLLLAECDMKIFINNN